MRDHGIRVPRAPPTKSGDQSGYAQPARAAIAADKNNGSPGEDIPLAPRPESLRGRIAIIVIK